MKKFKTYLNEGFTVKVNMPKEDLFQMAAMFNKLANDDKVAGILAGLADAPPVKGVTKAQKILQDIADNFKKELAKK